MGKKYNCNQLKCAYRVYGGCRPCKQCKAPPNELDDNCDICYGCSKDEGILRWDDSVSTEDETVKEELKPIEVKI